MRFQSKSFHRVFAVAVAGALLGVSSASAQVDNLEILVPKAVASGTNSLGSFTYDPTNDVFYSATFGAGGAVRKIVKNTTSGLWEDTIILNEGDIALFNRDGDVTRPVVNSSINGLLFNPAPVGTIPAYGSLWMNEGAITRPPNSPSGTDPAATKRVTRYNLQPIPSGGSSLDVMFSVANLQSFQTAASTTQTSSTMGSRRGAFSPNGQTIYVIDNNANFGGLYAVNPLTGSPVMIVNNQYTATGAERMNSEPAVARIGGVDRIFFTGNRASSAPADDHNFGGINYVDYDGVNLPTAQVPLVLAADLSNFLQSTTPAEVWSLAMGDNGTLYFWDRVSRRLIARDEDGRMHKVTTFNERDQFFTGGVGGTTNPNPNALRLQTRNVTHPTAGAITQVMFAELTSLNFIAGAYDFLPTDFDRDGDEDQADMTAFGNVLTSVGVAALIDNARYDMNGNGVIDFKDVRIAQSFQAFPDGDADFNGAVEFNDLLKLAKNYGLTSGRTWIHGDFDGNDAVNFNDLLTLARNYGVGVPTVLSGVSADFAADWALAQSLVPEPTSFVGLAGLAAMARRKRIMA